ncbi:hypothetical protein V8Z74_19420 [Comamonas sp. w2-DMI]|uniref:hypothetical protein n=1 Tax=Comamonas sp. w2-DMI TaxID=3126391 RepID=UPI0032E43B35
MQDKNVIKLTEQDAVLLEQAASMLEGLENDERNRGNCSTAEGAGCSAHAVRRLASALLAHEREIGQCLHQIAEPTHPTACTVDEVRAFKAAAAPVAVAAPDSSNLGFTVEQRGDVWVVVEDAGGVCPASSHECALWNALIEARAALAAAPAAAEWCVHCGATASAVCQSKCANRVCPQGLVSAAAPVVLPSGWVPCIVTYEGQHPEEVAYGPQVMMDRLKKWLERYFELKAAAPAVLPDPVAWAISYDGKTPYALWPEGDGALLDTEIKRLGGTARKMPLYAASAADALDAARYRYLRDEHIGDDPGSINLAPARKRGLDSAIDAAIAAQDAAQGGEA